MNRPQRLAELREKWATMHIGRGGGAWKQDLRAADSVAELDVIICGFLGRYDWGARYPAITRSAAADVLAHYAAIRADFVELDGGVR